MQRETDEACFRIRTIHATEATVRCDEVLVALEAREPTRVDLWLPSLAPSQELWRQFSCDDFLWHEFCRRYQLELERQPGPCESLRALACECRLTLTYLAGDCQHNLAIAVKQHVEQLECRRRYAAGWIIGGLTWPVREEIQRYGGLWFARHKVWTMPSDESWKYIQSLLPGEF